MRRVRTTDPAPDVTVIVPVYNTMPYLRRCLRSLIGQTIGVDRMEIIAVDDGSTDGSGRVLDRLARAYPDTVRVVHQANSGGPAGPCNRALDLATGRYVFFVGADDHLGPDALRRLVAAADRYGSDVVAGRVVGVNSRFIHQGIFVRDEVEIGLADSALPWSLTNVKLFRRDLIERHAIRYPEDMPLGSDLPFTLEACHRATRVSVLAGYDCYYAVRRLDAHNITHLSDAEDRLNCLRRLVEFTTTLLAPGQEREAVLARLFGHEVAVLLGDDLLGLGRTVQRQVHRTVRDLGRRHLTAAIADTLEIETRLRVAVAARSGLDELLELIGQDAGWGAPPTVREGDRWYAGYPALWTSPATRHAYEVTGRLPDWAARLDVVGVRWVRPAPRPAGGGPALELTIRPVEPELRALLDGPVEVYAEGVPATVDVPVTRAGPDAGRIRARFGVADLVAAGGVTGRRVAVRARLVLDGRVGTAPVRAPNVALPGPTLCRRGWRLYAVASDRDPSGRLMISVVPVTAARLRTIPRRIGRRIGAALRRAARRTRAAGRRIRAAGRRARATAAG